MSKPYMFKMFVLLTSLDVLGLDKVMRHMYRHLQLVKEENRLRGSIEYLPLLDSVLAALPETAPRLQDLAIEGCVTGVQAWLPLCFLPSLKQLDPGTLEVKAFKHKLSEVDLRDMLVLLLPKGIDVS